MPVRYDLAELLPPQRTPEGFLLASGVAAKPGVYPYRMQDGTVIRELVTADTLADRDSLATLGRSTVTLDHPPAMVSSVNVDEYGVGDLDGEVEVDERGYVRIKVAVRRADAVAAVDGGIRQLSCGYECDVDPTPGVHPTFGEYDQQQRRRRYNHVAIVERGRHGEPASLRADAAAMVATEPGPGTTTDTKEGPGMDLAKLIAMLLSGGMEEDRCKDTAQAIMDAFSTEPEPAAESEPAMDAAEAARIKGAARAEKDRADAAEAKLTEVQAKLDAIDPAAIAAQYIADREPLVTACKRLKLDHADSATNADLRKTIAEHAKVDAAAVDVYVSGYLAASADRDDRFDGGNLPAGKAKKSDADDPFTRNGRIERGINQ